MTKTQMLRESTGGARRLDSLVFMDEDDQLAGELIDWLTGRLPDDATIADALAVVSSAQWWLVLWGSEYKAQKTLRE